MWIIGEKEPNRLLVPTHPEIEGGAFDVWAYKGQWWLQSQPEDWSFAEDMARIFVAGQLFWRLGRNRAVSQPLADALVRFSVLAHEFWWHGGGKFKPHEGKVVRPSDFLAGIGGALIGGDGWRLIENAPSWPNDRDTLAYQIWEAQRRRHGHDLDHKEMAEWLLEVARWARSHVAGDSTPTHSHFLMALASMLIYQPRWSAQIFERGQATRC